VLELLICTRVRYCTLKLSYQKTDTVSKKAYLLACGARAGLYELRRKSGFGKKKKKKAAEPRLLCIFSKTLLQGEVLLQWNASIPIA